MKTQVGCAVVTALLSWGGIQAGLLELSSHTTFQSEEHARAAALRPGLVKALDDAAADDLIPVVFVLDAQVDRDELRDAGAGLNREQRRKAVVDTLRDHGRQTSAGVVAALEAHRAAGGVEDRVRALWIHNVVAARATGAVIREIAARDDVAYAHYDRPVNDEVFTSASAGGYGDPTCGIEVIGAPQAWNELNLTGRDVVVGVIDSGTCLDHPDLASQVWANPGEVPDGTDTDGNGYVDDLHGWNFKDDSNDVTDNVSHGTHVAGTVLGSGENGTHTGVAPDAELMTLKIWGNVSGESTVWEAMQYGVANGADALTGSIGWLQDWEPDRATWRAVCENAIEAGVVVLYAAGNEGDCCPPYESVRTPGDVPGVVTVGATNCSDELADFSSIGPVTWQDVPGYNDWPHPPGKRKPTVVGPGVNVISTFFDCAGYTSKSGTSMSTPHVAGIVALMLEANPMLEPSEVKAMLEQSAIDMGVPGPDNTFGAGQVDAYGAAQLAAASFVPPSADINGDGVVDAMDLGILLSQWGACPPQGECSADLTGSGTVGGDDMGILLTQWD